MVARLGTIQGRREPGRPAIAVPCGAAIFASAIFHKKEGTIMLILIIVLLLLFGGGGGYYGHSRWGVGGGAGIGLGTIVIILLIAYLLGGFR